MSRLNPHPTPAIEAQSARPIAAPRPSRLRVGRLGIVTVSAAVMALTALSVWALARTSDDTPAAPLFVVDQEAAAVVGGDLHTSLSPQPEPAPSVQLLSPEPVEPVAPGVEPGRPLAEAGDGSATRRFNGRAVRPVRQIRMLVTAYSPDERSCGKWADGRTAAGYSVWTNRSKLVAADTRILPFGSLVQVPGYDEGRIVPVLDRGGKIKGRRLDVLFPTHERAMEWGRRWVTVTVYEFVEE